MNTKQEFLEKLGSALKGTVDDNVIYTKISYYENYIDGELKNGRSINDILLELGDPTLIAKTIKTVEKIEVSNNNDYYSGSTNSNYANNNANANANANDKHNNFYGYMSEKSFIGCIISLLVVFILFSFVWRLFFGTVQFAVSFLGVPGIIIIIMLWYLFYRKR